MKTVEEAAKEYAGIDKNVTVDSEERYFNSSVPWYDAFKAGVEFAQRWISVDEEPPKNVWILVKNDRSCGTAKIAGEIDLKFIKANFTHWRPIEIK